MINNRGFITMAGKRLNRFPTPRDEFDQCISFVNNKIYLCVKIDREWFVLEATQLRELYE